MGLARSDSTSISQDSSLSPGSQENLSQVIALTAQNSTLTSSALQALRGTSRDIRQVVDLAAQSIVVSQEYPLERLKSFPNLRSLTCQGSFDANQGLGFGDLFSISQSDGTFIRALTPISKLVRPFCQVAFQINQLRYRFLGGQIRDTELHSLRAISGLRQLRLENLEFITDIGLLEIGKLSRLEFVGLRNCPNISGEGLRHFKTLLRLQAIDLTGQSPKTLEQSGALDALSNFPQLEDVQFGALKPDELKVLAAHSISSKVKGVDIRWPDRAVCTRLASLPQLEKLTIAIFDNNSLAREMGERIGDFQKLRSLDFTVDSDFLCTPISMRPMLNAMATLSNLTSLSMATDNVNECFDVRHLTQLQTLKLGNGKISATILSSLPKLRSSALGQRAVIIGNDAGWSCASPLRILKAHVCSISPLAITTLRNLPELESLDLSGAELPENFEFGHLADLEQLQHLDLSDCRIVELIPHEIDSSDDGLSLEEISYERGLPSLQTSKLTAPLPNLAQLSLRGWELSKKHFDFIRKLPQLTELDLNRAQFAEADLQKILAERPRLRTCLTELAG